MRVLGNFKSIYGYVALVNVERDRSLCRGEVSALGVPRGSYSVNGISGTLTLKEFLLKSYGLKYLFFYVTGTGGNVAKLLIALGVYRSVLARNRSGYKGRLGRKLIRRLTNTDCSYGRGGDSGRKAVCISTNECGNSLGVNGSAYRICGGAAHVTKLILIGISVTGAGISCTAKVAYGI